MRRRELLSACLLAAAPWGALAQGGYPSRPVRLVVPFSPGGPTDIMGRTAAKLMGERLGQPFVVENKAGAGGNIGTDAVAKAAPDGHTLALTAISSLAIAPHLYARLPFNVQRDLKPVSLVGTTPCAIVVNPQAPFDSLKALVAFAKARPGQLGYGTSGVGTANHLAAELLQSAAGIELTHVPYKGSGPILQDLLAGTLMMSMESSLTTTLPHIRAGKLKALAVTSAQRSAALPDVPTVAESGYPDFAVEAWFGLVAPAATPDAVVRQLAAAWRESAATPQARQAFDAIAANLRHSSPEEFGAFIQTESQRWGALIKRLQLKAG